MKNRLFIKIGNIEFEVEGNEGVIGRERAAFLNLILHYFTINDIRKMFGLENI
jgi:hypothetical protein